MLYAPRPPCLITLNPPMSHMQSVPHLMYKKTVQKRPSSILVLIWPLQQNGVKKTYIAPLSSLLKRHF